MASGDARASPLQVRLEVGTDGQISAAYAEAPGHRLQLPLELKPALKAEYFDVRRPAQFWSDALPALSGGNTAMLSFCRGAAVPSLLTLTCLPAVTVSFALLQSTANKPPPSSAMHVL